MQSRAVFSLLLCSLVLFSCRTANSSAVQNQGSTAQQASAKAQLNSSILMMGDWDYGLNNGTSNCMTVVDRATQPGLQQNNLLNFVPTHYFIAHTENGAEVATQFCHSRNGPCPAFDAASVAQFQNGMSACFQHAIALGANLNIVPHLDDGLGSGVWRNNVQIDPYPAGSDNCNGNYQSYYCIMLKPLAMALNQALKPGIKVYMATQGEMGATVFRYPAQYTKILPMLKTVILNNRPDLNPADIHLGLSVNHESIFGQVPPGSIDSGAVAQLFQTADFLGVSAYIASDIYPYPQMFDGAYDAFNSELNQIGLNLKKDAPALELDFSEIGIGGGINGGQIAHTRRECASATWDGIGASYSPNNDPWLSSDCAAVRREYYCAITHYLAGDVPTTWQVKHAFIWNLGSWDVQNVYPNSVGSGGQGYGDTMVMSMLHDFNSSGGASCTPDPAPNNIWPAYPMLENFANYDQIGLERSYTYNPAGNTLAQNIVSQVGTSTQPGMQLTYRIGSGASNDPSYTGLYKNIYPPSQAATSYGIKFHFAYNDPYGPNTPRYFIFQVKDQQGHTWEKVVLLTSSVETDVQANFSGGFTKPCWYTGNDYGDPNPSNISTIAFYINGSTCNQTAVATPSGSQESVSLGSLQWQG